MKNILVVDSDPITLHSIVGLLKSQTNLLNVISADSIETALDALEKGDIHLLITTILLFISVFDRIAVPVGPRKLLLLECIISCSEKLGKQ